MATDPVIYIVDTLMEQESILDALVLYAMLRDKVDEETEGLPIAALITERLDTTILDEIFNRYAEKGPDYQDAIARTFHSMAVDINHLSKEALDGNA